MAKRTRAPIEQLREAGRVAKQMLADKGIIRKHSVLDEIMHQKDAPLLPGLPVYLPHQWTIRSAQQIMRDLLSIWVDRYKDDATGQAEDLTEFFKFIVGELRRQESDFNKEIVAMPKFVKQMKKVPILKDVFSPIRKKEVAHAIHRFFVDSFACAIVLKNNNSVSEYVNWFIDWTEAMYQLWIKPEERKRP